MYQLPGAQLIKPSKECPRLRFFCTLPSQTPEPVLTVVPVPNSRSWDIGRYIFKPRSGHAARTCASLLGYKAAHTGTQKFQYIAPHSASPAAPVTPTHSAPSSPSVVRDSVATIILASRPFSHDRKQSIGSTLSVANG